jgi:hypothetical protein
LKPVQSSSGPQALDSESVFERTSSGENAVSFVSGDPLGEATPSVEPGLLSPREESVPLMLRPTGDFSKARGVFLPQVVDPERLPVQVLNNEV